MDVNWESKPNFSDLDKVEEFSKLVKKDKSWFSLSKTYLVQQGDDYGSFTLNPWQRIQYYFNPNKFLSKIKPPEKTKLEDSAKIEIVRIKPQVLIAKALTENVKKLDKPVSKNESTDIRTQSIWMNVHSSSNEFNPYDQLIKIKRILKLYSAKTSKELQNKNTDKEKGTDKEILKALEDLQKTLNEENPNHENRTPLEEVIYLANKKGANIEDFKERIKMLIDFRADVNRLNHGKTPLALAIEQGNADIVALLLEKGANPNQTITIDNQSFTPLTWAIKNKKLHLIATLIKFKADVNKRFGTPEIPPLLYAIENGDADYVKALIDNAKSKIDLNIVGGNNYTPLTFAIHKHDTKSLRILLESGAKANKENGSKIVPVREAINQDDPESLNILISFNKKLLNELFYTTWHERKHSGLRQSPLAYAIDKIKPNVVATLLSHHDARIRSNDQLSWGEDSPIEYATYKEDHRCFECLFPEGYTVQSNPKLLERVFSFYSEAYGTMENKLFGRGNYAWYGGTPFGLAFHGSFINQIKFIHFLLKIGVDIEQVDQGGLTPIARAFAYHNYMRLFRLWGANAEKIQRHDLRELFKNIPKNQEVAEFLLDFNIEPNWNINGVTPLFKAIQEHKEPKFISDLIKSGADLRMLVNKKTGIEFIIEQNNLDYFKVLKENGVALEEITKYKMINETLNLVYQAYQDESSGHISNIISKLETSDLNKTIDKGFTQLTQAIVDKNIDTTKALLKLGADPNLVDANGKSPLEYAIDREDLELIKLLQDYKVDINRKNSLGLTPFAYAMQQGKIKLFELFLNSKAIIQNERRFKENELVTWTPLHFAAELDDPDVVKALLDLKQDSTELSWNKWTALEWIIGQEKTKLLNSEVFKNLVSHEITYADFHSILSHSALKNKKDLCLKLLDAGADPNKVDGRNFTPLMVAAQVGHLDLITAFLNRKADINKLNTNGKAAIDFSILSDNEKNIRYLMLMGAKLQEKNENRPSTLEFVDINKEKIKDPLAIKAILQKTPHNPELAKFLLKFDMDLEGQDEFGNTPIFHALNVNREFIKDLLKMGADPNKTVNGKTLIEYAIENGDIETIKLLKENGIDLNKANFGVTPLQYAIKNNPVVANQLLGVMTNTNNQTEIQQLSNFLLDFNMDPHQVKEETKETTFSRAMSQDNPIILRLLLQMGVKENLPTGFNSLTFAVSQTKPNIIKELIRLGRNPNQADDNNKTPLEYAIDNDNSEIIQLLRENGANINQINQGQSPFAYAIAQNKTKGLKTFKDLGAIIQTKTNDKIEEWEPLIYAIEMDKLEVLKMLIELNENPKFVSKISRNKNNYTPLGYAVANERTGLFSTLVQAGGDDIPNLGFTALTYAVHSGNQDVVSKLIDAGVDVNKPNNSNETPLTTAISKDNADLVLMLLEKGADVNLKIGNSVPLVLAIEKNNIKMIRLLMLFGADVSKVDTATQIKASAEVLEALKINRNPDLAKFLLPFAMDPNHIDKNSGYTPLTLAINESRLDLIEPLLKLGADINGVDGNNTTPLILSIKQHKLPGSNRLTFIKKLLNNGVDVSKADRTHRMPIEQAIDLEKIDVLNMLIRFKPDLLNKLNKDGSSPFAYAIENEKRVFLTLLESNAPVIAYNKTTGKQEIYTSIEYAIEKELENVFIQLGVKQGLKEKGSNGLFPIEYALENDKLNFLQYIVKIGGNILLEGGFSALTNAIHKDRPDHVIALLKAIIKVGANFNEPDGNDKTPLYYAIRSDDRNNMQAIIDSGVFNINLIDKDGYTPLTYAMTQSKDLEMVKMLLKNNAKIDVTDGLSQTPSSLIQGNAEMQAIFTQFQRSQEIR